MVIRRRRGGTVSKEDKNGSSKELALFADALLASPKKTRRNFVSCDRQRK
jgi:hypothetical protein